MLAAVEILIASFPQVFLVTAADDLDCTPGFQQKVIHIQQPAEFIEDQPVLNCKPSQDAPGPLMWTSLLFERISGCGISSCFLVTFLTSLLGPGWIVSIK